MHCPYCGTKLKRDDNDRVLGVISGEGPISGHCGKPGCSLSGPGSLLLHHPHSDRLNDVRNTERGPGDSWSLSYVK